MRYAIFDIDGTISQGGQPITAAMANALSAARAHYEVVFASARPVRDMLPLLPDHLHDVMMVGCNGGMAWQGGNFLINEKFPQDTIAAIVDWLDDVNAPYVIESHWQYAFSPVEHAFHDYVRSLNTELSPVARDGVMAEGVNKLLILDMALRETLLDHISTQDWQVVEKLHRADHCFDLMPHHTDKAHALERLEIPLSQAIVFGNDLNDQTMLARAGHSVAVGAFDFETPPHQRVSIDEVPQALFTFMRR